jgi:hypothetical protein
MTPFEAIYEQNPASVLSYMPSVLKAQEVDNNLAIHETILNTLKTNFSMPQNHMKQKEDQGNS